MIKVSDPSDPYKETRSDGFVDKIINSSGPSCPALAS